MFYNSLRRRWGRISFSVFFAATIALIARAQSPPDVARQAPPIVRSIDVQYTGPATISRERILAQMRTKVGLPYSDTVAETDIRALYNTGQVQNVRIFGQPESDGVKVIVAVQTRTMLNEIQIDGATRISPKKLRKNLGVKLNTPLREEDLEKGREKIMETYQAHGFNDVEVTFRVEAIDAIRGTSRAVYTVNEGIKGSVSTVRFEGNTHFSDRVLRKQMKTRQKTLFSFVDKSGRLDETQLQDDLQKVREFYQNHGYIDVAVRDVTKQRTSSGALQIVIAIDEGPQYHVGKLTFVGYKATNEQKLRAVVKMKEGSVYSAKAIKDDAKALADAYGSGGYVDLTIVPETSQAHDRLIDITYKIDEGQRSYVERISISGNTRTKDKVIRREVLIAPGDIFNTVRVETSKKRLENLGYFSKVDTFPVDTEVEGRKYLDIQVEEKRTGSLNFGAGFSTIDSLIGFIELTQGNFDITNWPSLTGGGQKFRIRLQGGTERKDVELALTEPWFMDRPISVGFTAYYHEANYLSSIYDQRNYGFSLDVRKGIRPFLYGSLGYRLESIDTFNVVVTASPQLLAETGPSTKSVFTANLTWDRRDNPFLTRSGERITYTWWVAGPGGTEQIYGFDVEASKYWRLPWDTILLINAEVAGVDRWGDQTKLVKIYDRLFLGGSNNLRGFDFRDVGPKDPNGEPLGGQSMARTTIEWTFPIVAK
ncbi:MAG: outer membrane protein assembly factor BamA, partial [Verrucomicrobia bacterium]